MSIDLITLGLTTIAFNAIANFIYDSLCKKTYESIVQRAISDTCIHFEQLGVVVNESELMMILTTKHYSNEDVQYRDSRGCFNVALLVTRFAKLSSFFIPKKEMRIKWIANIIEYLFKRIESLILETPKFGLKLLNQYQSKYRAAEVDEHKRIILDLADIKLKLDNESDRINNLESRFCGLTKKMGELQFYLDGLPESIDELKNLIEKALNSIEHCKWEKAIQYLEKALVNATKKELAAIHNIMGYCFHSIGDIKKALYHFKQSLGLSEQYESADGKAIALGNLGLIYMFSNIELALDYHHRALKLNTELEDVDSQINNLHNLGVTYQIMGDIDKALQLFNQAIELFNAEVSIASKIQVLSTCGFLYSKKGLYEEANEYLVKSLDIAYKANNQEGIAKGNINISILFRKGGDFEKSFEYAKIALKTAYTTKRMSLISNAHSNLGLVLMNLHNYDEALRHHEESLGIDIQTNDYAGQITALLNIGCILLDLKNHAKAIEKFAIGLSILRNTEIKEHEGLLLFNTATAYKMKGNIKQALECYKEAHNIFKKQNNLKMVGITAQKIHDIQGNNY